MNSKKILIVGADSYIGNSFEKWVRCWPSAYKTEVIGTINDEWSEISFKGYDCVMIVAGIAHQKEKEVNKDLYFKINSELPVLVAKKAKEDGVLHFIFLSSMSVYGMEGEINADAIIGKSSSCNPASYYGKSKLKAEKCLESLSSESFIISIIRPPMVYGKDCKGNFQLLLKLVKFCPVFPKINNCRSMIYIDNLTEFLRQLVNCPKSGLHYPQNTKYINTFEMVSNLAKLLNRKIIFTSLLNPFVYLMSKFITTPNKLFGNLIYDQSLSESEKYNTKDFYESLKSSV